MGKPRSGGAAKESSDGPSKLHKFETFSQRIARFKVDPIYQLRSRLPTTQDADESSSFFLDSLERWKDLNMSLNFTNFIREVSPYCNSLPQVLHFEDKIVGTIIQFVELKDALSLEPLLNLLVQLARDLGARFERHFGRVVSLVSSLAASHPDVEVIEWSFNCLACLFKILSKFLVPDLRPIYDLMAPLLGREEQKAFVARFAAEAMAHLVRKAAATFAKDETPLRRVVDYAFADLVKFRNSKTLALYQQALVLLYSTAAKGAASTVHTCGLAVLRCMLQAFSNAEPEDSRVIEDVVRETVALLIRHSAVDDSHPVTLLLKETIAKADADRGEENIKTASVLLFTVLAINDSLKISAWPIYLEAVEKLLFMMNQKPGPADSKIVWGLLVVSALALQRSPMQIATMRLRGIMKEITSQHNDQFFPPFCLMCARIDEKRFRAMVLPDLEKFIVKRWCETEDEICLLVSKLNELGALAKSGQATLLACPQAWQDHIVQSFAGLATLIDGSALGNEEMLTCINRAHVYSAILPLISIGQSAVGQIRDHLSRLLHLVLRNDQQKTKVALFVAGMGFVNYVRCSKIKKDADLSLWPLLCSSGAAYSTMPLFLQGCLDYLEIVGRDGVRLDTPPPLLFSLVENLSGPSHPLRQYSLQILQSFHHIFSGHESDLLSIALVIEQTPISLQNSRTLSMQIRRLAATYLQAASEPWVKTAVVRFCFGILCSRMLQMQADVYEALKAIAGTTEGEERIADMAFNWLESHPSEAQQPPDQDGLEEFKPSPSADFEDAHLRRWRNTAENVLYEIDKAPQLLRKECLGALTLVSLQFPEARLYALEVFRKLPQIAERRSRRFVPYFLEGEVAGAEEDEDAPIPSSSAVRFSRKEKKVTLDILASFNNPKVLYRASDVWERLLLYLTNGDADLQKPSLEAIFTWKSAQVTPFKDRLRNLLDESRLRDEIVNILQDVQDAQTTSPETRKELMPLLLRLLYGRAIARKGAASGGRTMENRRRLVLKSLAEASVEELEMFTRLTIGPLDRLGLFENGAEEQDRILAEERVPPRQQLGILNMILDMVHTMGHKLTPLVELLLEPVIYCLARSYSPSSASNDQFSAGQTASVPSPVMKSLRQSGYESLNALIAGCPDFDWQSYMKTIFCRVIDPRVDKLPVETAQAPSGILRILVTWSCSSDTLFYLSDYNEALLAKIAECVLVPSAKDIVKSTALGIFTNIMNIHNEHLHEDDTITERIRRAIIQPNLQILMKCIDTVFRSNPGKPVAVAAMQLLHKIPDFVEDPSECRSLLEVSLLLLGQPRRLVGVAAAKLFLVRVVCKVLPSCALTLEDVALKQKVLITTSSLFGHFQDRESRQNLSNIIRALADVDPELKVIADLCHELNSFSTTRLDEPDFGRRLKAFEAISSGVLGQVSVGCWHPVVENLLYFMLDTEEFAIRSNASHALSRLLSSSVSSESQPDMTPILTSVIIPAVRRGMQEESELVRTEHVSVLAHIVKCFPSMPQTQGLYKLLAEGDEEASFFNNVLHIQQHRRIRALRRLSQAAARGELGSSNIRLELIPLIEHFILKAKDNQSFHELAAETVSTIGALMEWVEWPYCRAYLRKLIFNFRRGAEPDKMAVRLLSAVADALGKAATSPAVTEGQEDGNGTEAMQVEAPPRSLLSATLPPRADLAADLTSKGFLPSLFDFLHDKDESQVSVRTLVSVIYVKLLKMLPSEQLPMHLPRALTDLCHILRSKAVESRDMARKTLAEITNVLGPECFAFVLKELKGALAKGYQLHVLSFTLHSLLVAGSARLKPGDLDYCLPQIVRVIMDDIFGTVGEEKDAEGYVTSMKEVKNSKSYDSMELIAKITTIPWLSSLVDPIRALLQQNLTTSLLRKVDELLRRISNGVAQNPSLQNQGLLVFCYGLLAQSPSPDAHPKKLRRGATSRNGPTAAKLISNSLAQEYKITQFSLDIVRNVLQKQEALKTPANITGLLPLLNRALFGSHESVKLSAIRLLHVIVRVPSKSINQHAPSYLAEAVEAIKARPSTEGELAQAAIKLVSLLLRERRDIGLDETKLQTHVAFLLRRLQQDIGEPNRQGATFTFLRAVLSRKIMVPEIYDVLDSVAAVMVTSQARESRDLARGVYVDFLLGYPQGRARYSKQLGFLAKNLEYRYPEGRQCILEVLHMLLSKIGGTLLQEIVATFMVPLVMVLVNDDDPKCREMAGAILKELFAQADDDNMALFTGIFQKWLNQDESPVLIRAALQCYSIYFGTLGGGDVGQLQPLLTRLQELLQAAHDTDAEDSWERVYYCLSLLLKLCETKPDALFTRPTKALWAAVDKCFYFPHNWVKLSAVKLIGFYLADFARSNKDIGLSQVPLTGSGGLQLTGDAMLVWTDRHLRILGAPVSRDLATQVVRNLVFLGRCLGLNNLEWRPVKKLSRGGGDTVGEADEEEEEEGEEGEEEEDDEEAEDDEVEGEGGEYEGKDDEEKPKEHDRGSVSKPAIQHMFSRLSAILRRDLGSPTVASLVPKTAALQLMAALCNHLSRDALLPSLPALSLALHHLTDPSIPEPRAAAAGFGAEFQALRATAHEVLALLQKVVGAAELMQQRSRAREAARDKREERRRKRRIDAVTDPARAQRQKRKKDDRKKVRRRERAAEHRGKRRGW